MGPSLVYHCLIDCHPDAALASQQYYAKALKLHVFPAQAMAILVSNGPPGSERMEVSRPGAVFKELTGAIDYTVTVGPDGWADFPVEGKNVAVWVQQ